MTTINQNTRYTPNTDTTIRRWSLVGERTHDWTGSSPEVVMTGTIDEVVLAVSTLHPEYRGVDRIDIETDLYEHGKPETVFYTVWATCGDGGCRSFACSM